MELEILENTKSKIVMKIDGEDHTFCNIIVKELQKNDNVKAAAYKIAHPLQKVPELLVETNDKVTAKKALTDAIGKIEKTNEKFLKDFKSQVK